MCAAYEPAIGHKVLNTFKSVNSVDLIEDREGDNISDTMNALENIERFSIKRPSVFQDIDLKISDDRVIVFNKGEVGRDRFFHMRIREEI